MGKRAFLMVGLLLGLTVSILGCAHNGGDVVESPSTTTPTTPPPPTTTIIGVTPPASLFNVSGAKAILSAKTVSASSSSVHARSVNANDILKYTASGDMTSIFSDPSSAHAIVSVIEKGPDGSLYIGFQGSILDPVTGSYNAFFRVDPSGSTEVVDDSIVGIGSWSGSSNFGELTAKAVQFDASGNIYYLGHSRAGANGSPSRQVLMKKAVVGTIAQLGNSNMSIYDFLVCPNGFVLFHGANANDYTTEWLRVNNGTSVNNVFYNDTTTGNYAYLRNYFLDKDGNIILIGTNLEIQDGNGTVKKYSGVIRVKLDGTGKPNCVEVIYDDNNMYSDNAAMGSQLVNGYWDGSDYKQFFNKSGGNVIVPVSLEAGITEELIHNFIKTKYQHIDSESLNSITFEGMSFAGGEIVNGVQVWNISDKMTQLISANVSGITWKQWRDANGLNGVAFGSAKKIIRTDDGTLYAVMHLDNWGTSAKGDRLYQLLNSSGQPDIVAFQQDSSYKMMKKTMNYGGYVIYLSEVGGYSKIFRLDLSHPASPPVDMTSDKANIEIYNYDYNPAAGKLMYDVYDYSNNKSYLAEETLTGTSAETMKEAPGYQILDVVSYTANN